MTEEEMNPVCQDCDKIIGSPVFQNACNGTPYDTANEKSASEFPPDLPQ